VITYAQAKAAHKEARGRFYEGETVWIVTQVMRPDVEGDVFWVTDADGLGDVGALLFPDGRVERRKPKAVDGAELP
jgi:hypothetical protein